jgi:hypothetical protein
MVIAGFRLLQRGPEPISRPTRLTLWQIRHLSTRPLASSNGLKTVAIYATDNAGSVGNKVMLRSLLNDSSPPAADLA